MVFPERFSDLPEYAFPRLRGLLDAHAPGGEPFAMSIGEPKHAFPDFVPETIAAHAAEFRNYPPNDGIPPLRNAISDWLKHRYAVAVDPDTELMVLNGTREGLYNAAMALCPETKMGKQPIVLTPNPFYQVYAVAALSVGAAPVYVSANAQNGFLPEYSALPDEILNRTAIAYVCSPSNPQGAVATADYWAELIRLAEKHDFLIFADECYSEIYRDSPPTGALQTARKIGADPERVLIFHSLSKRSNLAGLRSGFVAGGPKCLTRIKQLRAYAGAPLPMPLQHAAAKAWADEEHVRANRALYQAKYKVADKVFAGIHGYRGPEGGFFLWLPVDDGEKAALKLWRETGIRVLPGAYLSREVDGDNPGKTFIRAAMVAPIEETQRGLTKLCDCLYN